MDLPDAGPAPSVRRASAHGPVWARAFLLVVPALWLGLIVGISLIEAPLKFTAPGITIPLGLGIGRRVFLAMNLVEAALVVLLLLALWRSLGRPSRHRLWVLGWTATVLYLVKVLLIRPFLNQRTDAVLSGDFAGGSATHLFYIAAESMLILALAWLLVTAVRVVLTPAPMAASRPSEPR